MTVPIAIAAIIILHLLMLLILPRGRQTLLLAATSAMLCAFAFLVQAGTQASFVPDIEGAALAVGPVVAAALAAYSIGATLFMLLGVEDTQGRSASQMAFLQTSVGVPAIFAAYCVLEPHTWLLLMGLPAGYGFVTLIITLWRRLPVGSQL